MALKRDTLSFGSISVYIGAFVFEGSYIGYRGILGTSTRVLGFISLIGETLLSFSIHKLIAWAVFIIFFSLQLHEGINRLQEPPLVTHSPHNHLACSLCTA